MTPVQMLFMGGLLLVVLFQLGFFSNPLELLIWAIAVVVAITVHEANHALVAVQLGDPTPRLMGRVSLNPLRHLDPIGTLMLVVARFGWGKPVLFNPNNLRINPAIGSAMVSAAGPVANILTAYVTARVLNATFGVSPEWSALLQSIVLVNVILAVFNLLPIPPLDGFGVVAGLAPKTFAPALAPLHTYGPLILLALVFLPALGGPNVLGLVMNPLIRSLLQLVLA